MKTRVELIKPSCPNPRDPIQVQLVAALEECIAWMDAKHRETPLSFVIVRDAKRVLDDAKGGTR